MYTRWRLYILALFLILIVALLLGVRLLRRRGVRITCWQATLFIVGAVLTAETCVMLTLSNFNAGVIMPAFFGVPMMLSAVLLPKMKKGTFLGVLKWIVVGCYTVAALIFIVCGSLMLSAQKDADKVECDALIVLGAAVHGDRVTWVLENRLNTAKAYLDKHPNAICIVSGGQGPGETVTEGSAMKKYLLSLGVAEGRVFAEEKATSTVENFRFGKVIADAAVGKDAKIAFVTTDFHVYRASRVAAQQGIDADGIPAPDVWYLKINNFMRECAGICVYALQGKI